MHIIIDNSWTGTLIFFKGLRRSSRPSVKAIGDGLKYQWYHRAPGVAKFGAAAGMNGPSYTLEMTAARSGRQVCCIITYKYGNSVRTNVVTLSMGKPVEIITQPKSVAVWNGQTAKVTVKATGEGLSYQWYHRAPGVAKFGAAAGMNGASYTLKMNAYRSGRQVFCVISDKFGNTVSTNVVTLRMK